MKRILVIGAGKSGMASVELLIKKGGNVILYDDDKKADLKKFENNLNKNIKIVLGDFSSINFDEIGIAVISPGISKHNTIVIMLKNHKIPIISELELGYNYLKGRICAVTGSNGKTTTVTLLNDILKKESSNVFLCGNMGTPISSIVDDTNDDSITVVETSSFQLEDIKNFKPNIACILNLVPDHMDRYSCFEDYINAKLNIIANQNNNDYVVLNYDDNILREISRSRNLFRQNIIYYSRKVTLKKGVYLKNNYIYIRDNNKEIKLLSIKDLQLIGKHNYENVMATICISYIMGVSIINIVNACKEFKGIEHRIEFVREKNGIKFYNDSKATNPDSAIKGLLAMKGKTVLIAGGHDKGIDFGEWISLFKDRVRHLILIGETKKIIGNKARLMNFENISYSDTLDEAVELANSYANIGDNVLLSPACSSYDMFKDFEERGNKFKEIVNNLK